MTGSLKTLALAALAAFALSTATHAAPTQSPESEPATMTYDFASGIKTTTLADGTVLEESFEVRQAKKFAPREGDKGVTSSRTWD